MLCLRPHHSLPHPVYPPTPAPAPDAPVNLHTHPPFTAAMPLPLHTGTCTLVAASRWPLHCCLFLQVATYAPLRCQICPWLHLEEGRYVLISCSMNFLGRFMILLFVFVCCSGSRLQFIIFMPCFCLNSHEKILHGSLKHVCEAFQVSLLFNLYIIGQGFKGN